MRKLISLILAVLMVSMMIPAMVLAEDSATPVDYEGLVAGETFTVTVENLTSATATISVNTQLFSINGAASATVDVVEGVASVEVTVNAQVPAVVEASRIKIEANGVVSYQVAAIADRLIGDANGDKAVNGLDATQVLRYDVKLSTVDAFKATASDVNNDGAVNGLDATQILRYDVKLSTTNAAIGVNYIGGNAAIEIVDPFEGTDTPAEPTALATPANIYAYAQNGKIYYTFDAVEGAEGYSIAVSTLADAIVVTDATGSFDCAYTDGLTITVTATTTAEGFVNSAASAAVEVIEADASGALAEWLEANGLENVAITVHEIK